MSNSTYKIGVEVTGDTAQANRALSKLDQTINQLGRNASSKIAGVFEGNAAASFASDITKSAGALESFIGPAGVVVGTVASIGGAAIATGKTLFDLAKNASDAGSIIKDFQDRTGLAAETISTLKLNLEQSGLQLSDFSKPLSSVNKLLFEASEGNEQATKTLQKFGVTANDTTDGALQKILSKIQSTIDNVEKMGLAMAVGGTKGAGAIRALAENVNGDLEGTIKKARELGITLSEEDVKAADDFGDTLHLLSTQVEATGNKFALKFAPMITGAMSDISKYLSDNQQDIKNWETQAIDSASNVVAAYRGVKDFFGSATSNIKNFLASLNIDSKQFEGQNNPFLMQVGDTQGGIFDTAIKEWIKKYKNPAAAAGSMGIGVAGGYSASSGLTTSNPKSFEDNADFGGSSKSSRKAAAAKSPKFEMSSKAKSIVAAANKLGVSPLDLAAIISYETKGSFNPNVVGGKGNNYQGLIQFGPEERSKYGVTKGQSFEQQMLGPVVKYFQDRFSSVGKSTVGASLMDLYKTVNGGNPTVSANTSDGNGTIAQHVARISREHIPNAINKLFGGKRENAKGLDETDIAKRNLEELQKGIDLVARYDEQVKYLGVTTERRKADLILETEEYSKLSEAQKQKIRDDADAMDNYTKESQATENYDGFIKSLVDDYEALNNVQPTATEQLNKYIAAKKAAGVIMDESGEAVVARIAMLFDLAKAQEKENDLVQAETQRYRDERDAIYGVVAAQQALTNEINRATLKPEQNFGVKNPNPGIADDDPTPKFKRTISANAMANATGRDFAAGGIFDQNTVDTQVSLMATLKETGMDTFKALAGEIGNAAAQWIAYGGASEQSLGQATKAVLASVSAQALGTGLYELGIGFAALTPWGEAIYGPAPLHFKSAAILLGMGAALGGIARAIPGGSKSSQSSSPDYQTTNSNYQNTSLNESNRKMVNSPDTQFSQLSQSVNNLNTTVDALHSKISSMKASDVVTKGFEQKPGLASQAVTKDLKRNGTQKIEMGKALGLK